MIADTFINIINFFFTLVQGMQSSIINILPLSPFKSVDFAVPAEVLGFINWCIPFTQMLAIISLWITCFIAYKAFNFILHIVKLD